MKTCLLPSTTYRVPRARRRARPPAFSVWVVVALFVMTGVAGCSSSKETADDDTFYLAAFEDFDAENHPDVLPPPPPEVTDHEIPDRLIAPGIEPSARRMKGYRVQLFASRDKREADAELQRAIGGSTLALTRPSYSRRFTSSMSSPITK